MVPLLKISKWRLTRFVIRLFKYITVYRHSVKQLPKCTTRFISPNNVHNKYTVEIDLYYLILVLVSCYQNQRKMRNDVQRY